VASPTVVASKSAIDGLRTVPTAVTLGALGVVYGDIGTSPLYALKEAVKAASAGGAPIPQSVTASPAGPQPPPRAAPIMTTAGAQGRSPPSTPAPR
jgi:K+ potassium transporter integral membrane domain